MKDSDFLLNNGKRSGEDRLPSSVLHRKKSRTLAKSAFIYLENHGLPLISSATGSPLHSIRLEPDRPYTIGRTNRNCDFVFSNRLISKRHCQIFFDSIDRKIYILDGTLLFSSSFSSVVNESRKRLLCSDQLEEGEEEEKGGCFRVKASLNGVFVNGVRIRKGMVRELYAGDEVSLVCGNEGVCSLQMQIGFVIKGIVIKEEVVSVSNEGGLERPQLLGTMTSKEHSQGPASSGKRNKRIFALRTNDVPPGGDFFTLQCGDVIGRANFLSSQCRHILCSDDPISYIRRCTILNFGMGGTCSRSTRFPGLTSSNMVKSPVCSEMEVKSVVPVFEQNSVQCDKMVSMVQSSSNTVQNEKVVGLEAKCDPTDLCVRGDHLHKKDIVGVPSQDAISSDNPKTSSLNSVGKEDASCIDSVVHNKMGENSCLPPGKKFCLNRLEFMDNGLLRHHTVISLPELLYPIESISQMFIATFTVDILWFLSCCEIPCHLPVTIACHNAERCWSSSIDKRASVPYPGFPKLVVVFPPFPEAIAFGNDRKKQGIACHHPKLLVLQREDSIRVIITSANLVAKQWNNVTNTVWWQDFPRTSAPDFSSLFIQVPDGEVNQDSSSDFAAQLASFIASLVIYVPSQAHWIVDLTNYDFGGAMGHLIASVPGIHSYRTSYVAESMGSIAANHCPGVKFLGSVEASVVGLSHLFHNGVDSNGAQLKKLAAFLGKSHDNAYRMLKIVLRRNTNVPADVNAVSVLVPSPNEFSDGDCIQLGFLPRNVAKWVSPLWDVGFFRFFGYVCRDDALAAAFGGNNKKVQLILYVSQGPHFSDISKMMQPVHVIALSSLIASIQRCRGLWRLQEVLGQYRWPELQESDFIYGASSIGSVNAQFLASFSAAAGKRSLQIFESEESDPEWGCWSVSQELKSPSIRIIFPTIERVKNAYNGILPSKRILCFSEKTWQRLRTVDILHDAIPHPHDRVGHPMHVKVARRRFQNKADSSSFGWVYCGSHNFSAAAWGRPIVKEFGIKANRPEKTNSSLGLRLHICNYELGIIFVFPPTETNDSTNEKSAKLDDIVLPFVVPAPKYGPRDRPATARAMREALTEQERLELVELACTEEMMEEIADDEDDVVDVTDHVVEKEEEKAYAEMLWSQVDSAQSC